MSQENTDEVADWIDPSLDENAFISGLRVYNSLTKRKDLFVPRDGKLVKWYICGPTVYDSSHMGHARNYVSFDVIRRIMEDYFGYTIFAVMNITDIDDKIIIQARKDHLYKQYLENNKTVTPEVIADLVEAYTIDLSGLSEKRDETQVKLDEFVKVIGDSDPENKKLRELTSSIELFNEKIAAAESGLTNSQSAAEGSDASGLLVNGKAQLSSLLDKRHGKDFDPDLLKVLAKEHSSRYEEEYMNDMKGLGVRSPDALTRVSEYIEEIIDMTQKIIENGYGYESNRSVYFDTTAFHGKNDHFYAKLEPKSKGDIGLQEESEGKLTDLEAVKTEKKHPNDFVLWKASKPGEPVWESPWGLGRPGWHIECSAMAGAILGDNIDCHSGGEDLRFPHHDNEMAQSEAFFDNKQWVNYFLHSGHLHIDGLKMSKSLKNFVTIGEILDKYTSVQIRLLYLMQAWDRVMNYERGNPMGEVDAYLHMLSNFFLRIENSLANQSNTGTQNWRKQDLELNSAFLEIQRDVDEAIKDNFDTAKALQKIKKLINTTNGYISNNEERRTYILGSIANFVTKIIRVFGLISDVGFGFSTDTSSTGDIKETLRPYLNIVAQFRTSVRKIVLNNENTKTILSESDTVRDNLLNLGVRLIDDGDFPFDFLSAQDVATLQQQAREKEIQQLRKRLTKLRNQIRSKKSTLEDAREVQMSVEEYMLKNWNVNLEENGDVPKVDIEGEDIAKGRIKKITKSKASFQKKQQKYSDPEIVQNLENEMTRLIQEEAELDAQLQ